MTEAFEVEESPLNETPLAAIQRGLGANLKQRAGGIAVASYGDVLLEYAAVREGGAGLMDLSSRGRIVVSGSEAIPFLNGLITNDMKTLAVSTWMSAAFPNVQGRLIAGVRVTRLKDEPNTAAASTPGNKPASASPAFLIDTEAATRESVFKTVERFTMAGDFHVRDISEETVLLSVQGKNAPGILKAVLGTAASELAGNASHHLPRGKNGLIVVRASHTGEDGFDLFVESEQAAEMWHALVAAGARPVGEEAREMLRIEAGQPMFGVDMDETNIVTEALDDAVSYTKGCYVGQEIIARIKYRGHVAKKLTGIVFPRSVKVLAGSLIKSTDDKEIGRVTSVNYSPRLGRTIALAFLKYDYLAAETLVRVVASDQEFQGTVANLPLVKGSWPISSPGPVATGS